MYYEHPTNTEPGQGPLVYRALDTFSYPSRLEYKIFLLSKEWGAKTELVVVYSNSLIRPDVTNYVVRIP